MIYLPLTIPILMAPIQAGKGISDKASALDEAIIPSTSGSFSWSAERTITIIWTSFWKPCGKRGRNGRSIRRALKISFSVGLPSRLKNPPGILPAAYLFSRYSTESGRKLTSNFGSREATTVPRTTVPPY